MKSIRNIAFSVLLTLGAFSAVTYTSCNKDECKDVVCQNGGTCNDTDGSCVCTTGYEGTNCETAVRTKYFNTYRGNGSGSDGTTFTDWGLRFSTVGTDATMMQLELLEPSNSPFLSVDVKLNTNTTFTVIEKTVKTNYTYTGSGSISESTSSLTLTEKDNSTGTVKTTVYTFNNMQKR